MPRELLAPADDTASRVLVDTQAAVTRVKELITEGVSKGWTEDELTKQLNAAIGSECHRIANAELREQTRKALVSAARKWHYELKMTYRVLNNNLAREAERQPLGIDIQDVLRKTPYERAIEFRKVLDDGTSPGIPVIKDYQRGVKLAIKALSAEPPKIVSRTGRAMPVRLRAEMAVRYAAAVENLQDLINAGVNFCWISSHASCSPRCAPYQGQLYSLFQGTATINGKEYGERGTIDGIPYRPINDALAGPKSDGNGCISGYNCRHRAIAYEKGSRPPADYTEAEMAREYAIDQQQRKYENQIRQLKTEERQLRAAGMTKEAADLRKQWRRLTVDYQIYSMEHDRAYYPYRYVIDHDEGENDATARDYIQWTKDIGAENMPKNIDDFFEMRYNNTEEYQLLRHYHQSRVDGDISALADFKLFQETKKDVDSVVIGTTAANGIQISSVSLHCIDRVIGTIYYGEDVLANRDGYQSKHEGLTISEFQKILFEGNPQKIQIRKSGQSQKITLDGVGSISINLEKGRIIQCEKFQK